MSLALVVQLKPDLMKHWGTHLRQDAELFTLGWRVVLFRGSIHVLADLSKTNSRFFMVREM